LLQKAFHTKVSAEYANQPEEINAIYNFEELVLCFDDLERISDT
jgi:hypothetical protein